LPITPELNIALFARKQTFFISRMIFVHALPNRSTMASRSTSSTVLIVLILIITFPFWIGIGALAIGLVFGLIGVVIGIVAAIFGAIIAIIALPFKLLFGWSDFSCDWPDFHYGGPNAFTLIALIIIVGLILSRRR